MELWWICFLIFWAWSTKLVTSTSNLPKR